jgi:predicted regulator of Ras-like GTPase activity (Roadblock/LC7/MglB family)
MPYKESLTSLVENVGGGLAAVIMGYDGIAIDEYLLAKTTFDLQLLTVEYANLLRDIKKTVELLENGDMEEVSIATDKIRVLVRVINQDFFLVLLMVADGNFGKGRYLLARESRILAEELK